MFLAEQATETTNNEATLQGFVDKIIIWLQTSGLKLLIGLIGLFIIFKMINIIAFKVKKKMLSNNKDETITNVAYEVIRKVSKVIVFILFLGYIGIDTAGIGSIIASCAVAIGLALQGSLANIAGWLIIIFMRPFKFGDYIMAQDAEGTVEDIKLFYTYIRTFDNRVIMIPNGALANGNITNYSAKKKRRVDLAFEISYQDDAFKAMNLISEMINGYELALKDPTPFVKISEYTPRGIKIAVKVWVNQKDYWDVYFDMINNVKVVFDENHITMPVSQVHLIEKN